MAPDHLRIISLIPSATEIVAALGMGDALVGRSHECDYPQAVASLPVCTAANLDPQGTSRQIHDRVTELLQSALSIYRIDLALLQQLQPTHILTQAQCDICAVSLAEVQQAVATFTQGTPQVISLQPRSLCDLWTDIQCVGEALGVDSVPLVQQLQARVDRCRARTQLATQRPRVACIEWTDPLMVAGNWVPELVALAAGQNLWGVAGQHSAWLTWETLCAANPDAIVLMPCGFNLDQTQQAAQVLTQQPQWQQLRAVQSQQVWITDGNHYFNRPGPRLVDSLELLAEILHPTLCPQVYGGQGWRALTSSALSA